MKKLFLTVLSTCWLLFVSAQYLVGSRTITFNDPARTGGFGSGGGTGRQIQTEIYYPATTAGVNVAVANGKFPVVVFGHGFVMTYDVYKPLTDSLVSRGYIVALPRTEGGAIPAPVHIDFGKDLALVLNKMIGFNDTASSPFFQKLNGRGAIGGHSMGGGCTFLADSFTQKAVCYFTLAAAETNPKSSSAGKRNTKPHLIVSGTRDCVAPQATNQNLMYDSLLVSSCKTQVYISGAYHCQFNNSSTTCNFGESTCKVNGGLTLAAQLVRVNRYVFPFLDYYLKADCSAWTSFQQRLTTAAPDSFRQSCNVVVPSNAQISAPQFICTGSSATLKAAPSGFQYSWNGGSASSIDSLVISQAGIDSVVVGNGTCNLQAVSVSVAAKAIPLVPAFTAGADTLCISGANTVYSVAPVSGTDYYTWQLPNGWSKISVDSTASITVGYGSAGGNIAVAANNVCGSSSTLSKSVTVVSAPAFGANNANTITVCPNAPGILLAAPDKAEALQYSWILPSGWSIQSGNGRDSVYVNVDANSGTAYATISGFCGAGTDSFAVQVNVSPNATPAIPVFINSGGVSCSGVTDTFSVLNTSGVDHYNWQLPVSWSVVKNDSSSIIIAQTNASGIIEVSATNSCGTSAVSQLNVSIDSLPEFGNGGLINTKTLCEGSTDVVFVSPLITNAISYKWLIPNGWIVKSDNGKDSVIVDINSTGGTVFNTAKGYCGDARDSFAVIVNVVANPSPVIVQSGNKIICTAPGVAYEWTKDGQVIQNTSDTLEVNDSGVYSVVVTDANGCYGTSQSLTYTAPNGLNYYNSNAIRSAWFVGDRLMMVHFDDSKDIVLYNMEGKKIMSMDGKSFVELPSLTPGIYLLSGSDTSGRFSMKIFKGL